MDKEQKEVEVVGLMFFFICSLLIYKKFNFKTKTQSHEKVKEMAKKW